MKVEKLKLRCNYLLPVEVGDDLISMQVHNVTIPLNQKIIQEWFDGMSDREKKSFLKVFKKNLNIGDWKFFNNMTELKETLDK